MFRGIEQCFKVTALLIHISTYQKMHAVFTLSCGTHKELTLENLIEINICGYSEQNSRSVFNGIDVEGMVCSLGPCSYTHPNTFKMCAYVLL